MLLKTKNGLGSSADGQLITRKMCSVLLLIDEICTEKLESTKCMIENKRLQIGIKANLFLFHSRFRRHLHCLKCNQI